MVDFKICLFKLLCLLYYKGKGLLRLWLGNCFEKQLHSFHAESSCFFPVGFWPSSMTLRNTVFSDDWDFCFEEGVEVFWQMPKCTAFQELWVYLWFPWRNFTRSLQGILLSPCNLVESQAFCLSSVHQPNVQKVILDLLYLSRNTVEGSTILQENVAPFPNCCMLHCAADSNWGSGSAIQSAYYF